MAKPIALIFLLIAGNGHVYCSEYISDEDALESLNKDIDGEPISEPNFLRFKTGVRKKTWNKNVVALGLSAGFLEPLESTSIHLIQTAVARLLASFPDKTFAQSNIDDYNACTLLEYEQVRDFLILHYCATERDDTPFWRYCKNMDIPDTLKHRIALYQDNARLFRRDNEIAQDAQPRSEPTDEVIATGTLQRDVAMSAYLSGDYATAAVEFDRNAFCALRPSSSSASLPSQRPPLNRLSLYKRHFMTPISVSPC